MSAHVLLNLLNLLRKSDKCLTSILLLFRNKFNKSNYTLSTHVRFYLSHDIKITLFP